MTANVLCQKVSPPSMNHSPSSRGEQNRAGRVPDQIQLLLCAELTIGRCPGVGGAVLISPTLPSMISRKHASIKFVQTASQWVIKDLNSMNGVCINHERLPRSKYTPLNNGDLITFGIDVSANNLLYVFTNTNKGCPVLVRKGRSENNQLPLTLVKRTHNPSQTHTPIKKARTNGPEDVVTTCGVTTVQLGLVPSPPNRTTGGQTRPNGVLKNKKASAAAGAAAGKKTPKRIQHKSSSVSSAENVKSATQTVVTVDSLFDPVKVSPREMLEEAIFGKSPMTPRAQAVLSGVGLSVAQIQMQMAQDEFEKEKNKLVSRCQAMEDELAAKNRLLVEKERKQQESILAYSEDHMFTSIEEELTCVICHELFIKAFILPCAHSFCELCITEWMTKKHNSECPVCRAVISAKPLHSLALDNAIGKLVAWFSPVDQQSRVNIVTQHEDALRQMNTAQSKDSINTTPTTVVVPIVIDITGDSSHLDITGDSSHLDITEDSSHLDITQSANSDSLSMDESVSGDDDGYYGGYGRCYACGGCGHWTSGCPFQ